MHFSAFIILFIIRCPSKLPPQHSAENPAGTQGKLAGKSLLYANINKGTCNFNKGKELLVGLGVGDNNNCMWVKDSSAHPPIVVGAWPMAVLLWQRVE